MYGVAGLPAVCYVSFILGWYLFRRLSEMAIASAYSALLLASVMQTVLVAWSDWRGWPCEEIAQAKAGYEKKPGRAGRNQGGMKTVELGAQEICWLKTYQPDVVERK